MKALLIGAVFISSIVNSTAKEIKNLKAFPQAAKGFSRSVITLPHKTRKEEQAYMVELVVGKVIKTDTVNQFGMNTSIEAKPLKGWGFTFYNMTGNDMVRSTLMAPISGQPKIDKFVGGQPLKIRYNSRIPIVIYTPENFEVRYRTWKTTHEFQKATE